MVRIILTRTSRKRGINMQQNWNLSGAVLPRQRFIALNRTYRTEIL